MAGIHLVHGGGDDRPAVEAFHVLFHLFGLPARLRQSNVEKCFLRDLLKRPGRVHGGGGQGTRERWRFLHNGQHLRRKLDDMVLGQKILQSAQSIAKSLEQLVWRRMIFFQFLQNLLRRFVRIEFCCRIFECLLVQPQVRHADLKQAIERDINIFIVQKLLAEIVGPNAEIAVRLRLEVLLDPLSVGLQFVHHFLVDGTKFSQQRLVFYVFEGGRHIILEKADEAGNLLQRNVYVDRRRVLQVLPRRLKDRRRLLLTGNDGFESLVSRRERTRHDEED